jgi:hypothetical protein
MSITDSLAISQDKRPRMLGKVRRELGLPVLLDRVGATGSQEDDSDGEDKQSRPSGYLESTDSNSNEQAEELMQKVRENS